MWVLFMFCFALIIFRNATVMRIFRCLALLLQMYFNNILANFSKQRYHPQLSSRINMVWSPHDDFGSSKRTVMS